ncbi:hypothetical protein [Cellulomonas marina]|uniref:Cell division septum initiation DivIVA, interacts with FtsZ, MinD n=1 Tax=Cellulomonas marina TaxID=988821 RepID=A0A1I0YQ18_9CELL|nr:hypothetical protein [Cellulomonas marina]GIG27600.1 hypothetical protein Cma02nite_02000 [Cellulomonas marina]SFB15047.1 hypothetical protein SAMN05421867_10874 [Cellulomonas marina]
MTQADGGAVDHRPEGLTGVLDALATAVRSARAMPMSSSVLVNRAELLDLVEQALEILPAQLSQADAVLARADAARDEARAEADALLARAREQAAELVSEERVVLEARAEAARIVAAAEATAEGLRRDADDWCDRRLADFEIDLGRVLSQVQAGRTKLADRLAAPAED